MENINSKSFRIIIAMMEIIGWYPQNQNPTLYAIRGYILYFLLLALFLLLIVVDIGVRKDYDDLQIIYVAEIANYCFKILPFFNKTKRHDITNCINYFNGSDFTPKDEVEKKLSEQCVEVCQSVTIIFVTGLLCTVALYILPVVLRKGYELPLQIWLPYHPNSGPLTYSFTVCYITTACLYDMCCTCLIDPLLGGLTYQAVTQLKILKYRVLHLQGFDENTTPISSRVIRENLKNCVEHHKAILRFVNEFEDCFSWPIFSQIFGTTIVLCFCCIPLTKLSLASVEGVKYLSFFLVVSSQVLFYCFFGTLLYEESDTLITSIYRSKWYEFDVKTRKMLIMFMERAKQPMLLTAGKIIDLTLATFVTVLKRSYSLVAVLK